MIQMSPKQFRRLSGRMGEVYLMVAQFRRRVFNWQFLALIIVEVVATVFVKLITGLI